MRHVNIVRWTELRVRREKRAKKGLGTYSKFMAWIGRRDEGWALNRKSNRRTGNG